MSRNMDYRHIITIEPGKRGGNPCIRGMRITVYDVLDYLAAGMSQEEILNCALLGLFQTGASIGVRPDHQKRVRRILHALNQAQRLQDLSIPGFGLHPLHGKPKRYAVSVNGPWRITFEWIEGEAWRVDLEQYH